MVQRQGFLEIDDREDRKDAECQDFLDRLQLGRRIDGMADPVGGNGKTVFGKRDALEQQHGDPHCAAGMLQVSIPRKGHEHVRDGQKQDRQDLRRGQDHDTASGWYRTRCLELRKVGSAYGTAEISDRV
jgi:hypothetical protein